MEKTALIVSIVSMFVAIFALGWNFYRDVMLKPRVKGSIRINNIHHGGALLGPFISLHFVNFGPGPVQLDSIFTARLSFYRFFGIKLATLMERVPKWAHVMYDYTNSYSDKLPKKLEVGEQLNLFLPFDEDAFLGIDPNVAGVTDSFGRYHCANIKSLKSAKKE